MHRRISFFHSYLFTDDTHGSCFVFDTKISNLLPSLFVSTFEKQASDLSDFVSGNKKNIMS